MVDFWYLIDEWRDILLQLFWIMIYNDVEIDAVFATGKESFAIISPC